jgi:serine/threonine-protein kinase
MNEIKLTDFTVPEFSSPIQNQKNINLRSVSYAAPEQIEKDEMDHRTDIYSLGIIFYELLSGKNPIYNEDKKILFENIAKLNPPPLSATFPHIPAKTDAVLAKALAKSPSDRFGNVNQFLEELMTLLKFS